MQKLDPSMYTADVQNFYNTKPKEWEEAAYVRASGVSVFPCLAHTQACISESSNSAPDASLILIDLGTKLALSESKQLKRRHARNS